MPEAKFKEISFPRKNNPLEFFYRKLFEYIYTSISPESG